MNININWNFDFIKNFFNPKQNSGQAAKERLMLVLRQDRLNISAPIMEEMKQDILKVILKYVVIDEEGLDIQITQEDGSPIIMANIPVKEVRRSK